MARPTLYKPNYCEMLLDYFSIEPYFEKTKKSTNKVGDVIEEQIEVANNFPTLAGFAIKLGVHRDTLQEWSRVHPEFSAAYKRAKDFQENFLVINGHKSLINTAFAIFTAKNVLGWRDKQPDEVDVVVNNVTAKSDDELDARIKELAQKNG